MIVNTYDSDSARMRTCGYNVIYTILDLFGIEQNKNVINVYKKEELSMKDLEDIFNRHNLKAEWIKIEKNQTKYIQGIGIILVNNHYNIIDFKNNNDLTVFENDWIKCSDEYKINVLNTWNGDVLLFGNSPKSFIYKKLIDSEKIETGRCEAIVVVCPPEEIKGKGKATETTYQNIGVSAYTYSNGNWIGEPSFRILNFIPFRFESYVRNPDGSVNNNYTASLTHSYRFLSGSGGNLIENEYVHYGDVDYSPKTILIIRGRGGNNGYYWRNGFNIIDQNTVGFNSESYADCKIEITISVSGYDQPSPRKIAHFLVGRKTGYFFEPRYRKSHKYIGWHTGIDIDSSRTSNTFVGAVVNGVVTFAGEKPNNYGRQVEITTNNGWIYHYCHLQDYFVKSGQEVELGQIIGLVGSTGSSAGNHLHLNVYYIGDDGMAVYFDPSGFLNLNTLNNVEAGVRLDQYLKKNGTDEVYIPWSKRGTSQTYTEGEAYNLIENNPHGIYNF